MYPTAIADQLRSRDHEVTAVTERPELRSLPDTDLFEIAQQERRALATENIADFSRIADGADQRGRGHYGLVLIHPAKFPRGQKRTIGRMVTALDRLLMAHPGEEGTGARHWL